MVKSLLLVSKGFRPRFSWNLDANVGLSSVNTDEDVALVQLGYMFMARHGVGHPDDLPIFARVTPTAFCNGTRDDLLVQAIIAHQKRRGGTQDGHVSSVKTDTGVYSNTDGAHLYQLIALNNNIQDEIPGDWPRIDKLGDVCPVSLRTAIAREIALPPRT